MDEMNKLFKKLMDYCDEPYIMNEFIKYYKYWIKNWNKGSILIGLINLKEIDNKFNSNELYVAYNDYMCPTVICTTFNFINDVVEELNNSDLKPTEYWTDALKGILCDRS